MNDNTTFKLHSWDYTTGINGPGSRLTIFFNGCPLRCLYCQNPDTFLLNDGKDTKVQDIFKKIDRYAPLFEKSEGGVTITGGEPLFQKQALEEILVYCKEKNVHTCIDTAGSIPNNLSDTILGNTDLFLLDIKSGDDKKYKEVSTCSIEPVKKTIELLNNKSSARVWVRFVLVPNLTDSEENIYNTARLSKTIKNIDRLEILPFHQLGSVKWEKLGLNYKLQDTKPPSKEIIDNAKRIFKEFNL